MKIYIYFFIAYIFTQCIYFDSIYDATAIGDILGVWFQIGCFLGRACLMSKWLFILGIFSQFIFFNSIHLSTEYIFSQQNFMSTLYIHIIFHSIYILTVTFCVHIYWSNIFLYFHSNTSCPHLMEENCSIFSRQICYSESVETDIPRNP